MIGTQARSGRQHPGVSQRRSSVLAPCHPTVNETPMPMSTKFERPDRENCDAPTSAGTPCQHPAPEEGHTCASDHVPVNHKRQQITQSTLRARGWTMAMIRDVLGTPDREVPNPRYARAGAPMKLYYLERVIAAEATEEFRLARAKADRRRTSSRKGLAAASVVQKAQAAVRAEQLEVNREHQIERMAEKYAAAALTLDPERTMAERRSYREECNELLREFGYALCRQCGWRHDEKEPCPATLKQAHQESRLAAQVDAVFGEAPRCAVSAPKKARRKRSAGSWSLDKTQEYMSKSEIRRSHGWSTLEIDAKLGQPDRIEQNKGTVVKLYLKDRVAKTARDRQ